MLKMCDGDKEKINVYIIFESSKQKDEAACQVVEKYMEDLSEGIADAVNIFRPEVILLGGGISKQGDYLTMIEGASAPSFGLTKQTIFFIMETVVSS